ncbi:transcriptional regulator GlxA family with amidase domain [Saccharothrix coeruleofusca]|uniref:DJ-1/PfpI family protein n=1 Tax=Saccharothrix coeruleofusca TaxID=33919 RepID=UPI001AE50C71|nr:DJ-1/PfpI family protein [Saccharothrix coeruleofusca]MBP2336959.1 transcriptional regulator GlxA family with amidase domain [Saccharothrix coeruleofusca]
MDLAFVLYPEFTALDLIGPLDVLGHQGLVGQEEVRVHFVAATREPVRSDVGLTVTPSTTFDELARADVVVVPGGDVRQALAGGQVSAWLREVHPTATWTTSVCTGSILLADAGLLAGRPATTHWAFRDALAQRGAVISTDRVVRDGKVITAAGVSAGIDMALTLVELIWGERRAQATQLFIEYDPQPPHDAGAVEKAPAEVVDGVLAALGRMA